MILGKNPYATLRGEKFCFSERIMHSDPIFRETIFHQPAKFSREEPENKVIDAFLLFAFWKISDFFHAIAHFNFSILAPRRRFFASLDNATVEVLSLIHI